MKNTSKFSVKIVFLIVVISMTLAACNTTSYSLTSPDQGNTSSAWALAQCVKRAGNDINLAAKCVK